MDARARVGWGSRRALARVAAYGLASLVTLAGCQDIRDETDGGPSTARMVPRRWRRNAWGPEAEVARLRGELPVVPTHPELVAWDDWGRRHLRDGDLVFRKGNARAFFGLLPFSRFVAAVSGSRFSHSGIVAIERGEPVVYDTCSSGVQRQPFATWLVDVRGAFAVKRPRAPHRASIPAALAFCRSAYRAQVPFDRNLRHGDDALYCVELTQRAYASAGLDLSRPVRLVDLPRYDEFPKTIALMKLFTAIEPEQAAYVVGNDTLGVWASPALEAVYDSPPLRPSLVGVAPPGSPR